ncbi:PTS sugar transporter subunit IIA [Brochothrix campestris]|uniref:PTS system glucose-specific transporter subunit IIA n=1 Tax=Brochothrix campestris FSL F6-1037 TaxID=1265861 RepID=W7CPW1_9LIST|nr:PTS glucose transporter subunit IIA [Brochothrix campestris]EUJ39102.1 PTS system glucose-specific transporter subunit IIA [Brochothrix campestris FSL F6-1037]
MFKKLFGKEAKVTEEKIVSPVTGTLIKIDDVPDPVFAQKMMGEGVAVQPTNGIVVAPVDGEIIQIADESKHAFGIRSALGQEILVHIGLETVAMKGEGFKVLVKLGDKVKAGQPIIEADIALIAEKAASTVIPVVVTNSSTGDYTFTWSELGNVTAGETVIFEAKTK